mmetsp:Transcript_4596/g.7028  ORF Transcript_4596/g.7028 Transcript_4596/m.7028 type:complete len:95 (-) Transcript_4596:3420-3704(-)
MSSALRQILVPANRDTKDLTVMFHSVSRSATMVAHVQLLIHAVVQMGGSIPTAPPLCAPERVPTEATVPLLMCVYVPRTGPEMTAAYLSVNRPV